MTPAKYVIATIGGVGKTARAIGRTTGAVSRWQVSKTKNGTDGRIPGPLHKKILSYAKANGLDIQPHHLVNGSK